MGTMLAPWQTLVYEAPSNNILGPMAGEGYSGGVDKTKSERRETREKMR